MSTLGIENIEHINGTNAMTVNPSGEVDMVRNKLGIFQVKSNTTQSIASDAPTIVALNTKVFDVDGYFNTSNYRYTPQVAGFYNIYGVIAWDARNADDNVYLDTRIYKNGEQAHSVGQDPYLAASGDVRPRGIVSIKQAAAQENMVGINTLVHFNGSTDYATLVGYIYNYSDASSSSNNMLGHATLLTTYMQGFRIG